MFHTLTIILLKNVGVSENLKEILLVPQNIMLTNDIIRRNQFRY